MIRSFRKLVAIALLAVVTSPVHAGSGRLGTATTQKVFHDASGKRIGTAVTDSRGTITVRDASGRVVISGSCSDPGRCKLRDNPRFFLDAP
jgi:hypothetical protein